MELATMLDEKSYHQSSEGVGKFQIPVVPCALLFILWIRWCAAELSFGLLLILI